MSTFGRTTADAGSGSYVANYQYADRYYLSEPGSVTSISVRFSGANATYKGKAFICADAAGPAPGALLGTTQELTGFVLGVNVLDFASPLALTAGWYWVGFTSNGTIPCLISAAGLGSIVRKSQSYATAPSDPFGTPSNTYTNAMDVWATYNPPPGPTSATPNSGSTAGGTSVTIAGSGFTGATGVTFGGTAATGVSVVSDSSITCTTPAHASGAVDVVVSGPYGSGTLAGGFTYTNAMVPLVMCIT